MPVRKATKSKKKKENKEPTHNANNISVHNGSIITSSVRTTTAVSNGHGGIKATATPKAAPKKSHIRSIKELSSALNLSASLSTSFSVSMMANNGHHHHHHLIQKCNSNRKITDYFQVRKSSRKCKSDLDKERRQFIEQAIKSGHDLESDSLEVRVLPDKGRAIFAARPFRRGEFVCEYAGEMIAYAQAKKREEAYAQDPSIGCYMYFFEYKSKPLCIDATSETSRLGRLLNHSKLDGNCQAKLFETEARPYIILVAARDIRMGEELTYDYGERNKTAIEAHPWLAT